MLRNWILKTSWQVKKYFPFPKIEYFIEIIRFNNAGKITRRFGTYLGIKNFNFAPPLPNLQLASRMRSGVRIWLLLVVFNQSIFMTNPYFWAKCLFYDKNWGIRSHYQPVEWLTVLEMLLWLTEALKTPHFLFDWSMKKWCKYVMLIYSWPTSQKWNFEKDIKKTEDLQIFSEQYF